MATKQIIKNTRRQAAVAIIGSGNATITVSELKYFDQNVDAANVELTISDIVYDVGNSANITRNGGIVYAMNAGQASVSFSRDLGIVLNANANSNVVVNLGAAQGTCIIQFTKGAGYDDPDRQNLEVRDR